MLRYVRLNIKMKIINIIYNYVQTANCLQSKVPQTNCIHSNALGLIHSFIHSEYLYSAPSRNLLRGILSPAMAKEKRLKKLAERRHVVLR